MATLGELTGFALDPKQQEEQEIRKELSNHRCRRCIIDKRMQKDRLANFTLLSKLQRSIYKESRNLPHRCVSTELKLSIYETCECAHMGAIHKQEELTGVFTTCNMKDCGCKQFREVNV